MLTISISLLSGHTAASLNFALEAFDRLLAAAFVPQILFSHLAPGLGQGGGKYSRRHRGH